MLEGPSLKVFSDGVSVLTDLRLSWYVSAGTALGFVRDGTFIPHDTDIDVEVITSYSVKLDVKEIVDSFSAKGLQLVRTTFDGHFPIQLAFMGKERVVFDVFFVYVGEEDGFAISYSEFGKLKTPMRFLEVLEDRDIDGVSYKVPSPAEEYCEYRYGLDWKVPKVKKGVWQDDASNLE